HQGCSQKPANRKIPREGKQAARLVAGRSWPREVWRRRSLKEELAPSRPPVFRARRDLPRLGDLDALTVAVLLDVVRRIEVHGDLAGMTGVVGGHGTQIAQRLLRACLDQLARLRRRILPRAEPTHSLLDGDRRAALA